MVAVLFRIGLLAMSFCRIVFLSLSSWDHRWKSRLLFSYEPCVCRTACFSRSDSLTSPPAERVRMAICLRTRHGRARATRGCDVVPYPSVYFSYYPSASSSSTAPVVLRDYCEACQRGYSQYDIRHTRGLNNCRYSHIEGIGHECPGCQAGAVRHDPRHTLVPDECRWGTAQYRVTGQRRVEAHPRDPRQRTISEPTVAERNRGGLRFEEEAEADMLQQPNELLISAAGSAAAPPQAAMSASAAPPPAADRPRGRPMTTGSQRGTSRRSRTTCSRA